MLRDMMSTHKFAIGQTIRVSPDGGSGTRKRGLFKIVRRLPEAENEPQYRVKSETDGYERVVRKNQLARV
jgi:hypothetical protein